MGTESSSWLHAKALWAGLSLITMWLAVLFVGVFGGNIVSSTPGGTSTSVPVVVAVLPFVLVASIVVGRRGFAGASVERHGAVDEEVQTREEPTVEPSALRTTPA